MAKPRNELIDWLQYVGLRLVSMMLHCWPVDWNMAGAALLGDVMYMVDKRHRERALGNLRRSFPDMPEETRKRMARESMRHLFMLFVEVLFTTRLIRIDTWAKRAELENFRETLGLMLTKHQGLIMP
jgi:Kdo2-lipid IVA lauroyltransferase/acyltransferase